MTGQPRWAPIAKTAEPRVRPNLTDYEKERQAFNWAAARSLLDGLPGGRGLNIAYEAVDRNVARGRGDKTAIRWIGRDGDRRDLTYQDLKGLTNRFANVLASLGIDRGDRVFLLAGRVPELYVSALGALKAGAVVCPMFSAFGPEPIKQRMTLGGASVLVTTEPLFRRKVASLLGELPDLRYVLVVNASGESLAHSPRVLSLEALMDAASPNYEIGPTDPEETALLHFTSGTTGLPKGALHVHQAVVAHHVTGSYALDLHPDDVFWCTADPGWVTGTSYGIISPLTHGVTSVVDEGDFDPERWYRVLRDERVTVWYSAPTALRMLMKAGTDLAREYALPDLRLIASVGEPLNPEVVVWGVEAFGLPIHDNWWQTETGGIMIANLPALEIRPGSMGLPLPGVEAAIVRKLDGGVELVREAGVQGELALRPGWPSMFRGYLNQEERYEKCFAGGWYLTGDLASRDADGYFWFMGRADDVIKSAGHLIGPFEVESVLMEHRAVAEAGVIGKPDPLAGEIVKAFVSLKPGFIESEDLRRDIVAHARRRLGAAIAPRELAFADRLPKTQSGKIMRRVLKARELGLPEGDTSTLESF
jgi:acetyl-CoA synthetase